MNTTACDFILADAWIVARMHERSEYADDLMRAREHYRKLAEREKALTEALEAAVACGMVPKTSASEGGAARFSEQVLTADKIRAALALHKEAA